MRFPLAFVILCISSVIFLGCEDKLDCSGCDEWIGETATKLASNCDANIFYGDACSQFVASQSAGVFREICNESDIGGVATCELIGRSNIDFAVSVFGIIPDEVRLEFLHNGSSGDILLNNNVSTTYEFVQFVAANELININLFLGQTSNLLVSATPKITYARTDNTNDVLRVIEIRHDANNGYRLFFYNWE